MYTEAAKSFIQSTMARLGRLGFLGIAVAFHLIYIYSIFDIYFVSPIVSGMKEYSVPVSKAPAQRLVLFVGTYIITTPCAIECMLNRYSQATVYVQIKRSNTSPTPLPNPTKAPTHTYHDHLLLSCVRACWTMALLVSLTQGSLPSPGLDMSLS